MVMVAIVTLRMPWFLYRCGFVGQVVIAFIAVSKISQLDPFAFYIGFQHLFMDAAAQWTSGLNLKKN